MNRLIASSAIALIVMCAILVSGVANAKDKETRYEVTTRGQVISPPIAISHNHHFELFSLGDSATPGLTALAEDGDTTVLKDELDASSSVYDYKEAGGAIMPGLSATVYIETKRGFDRLSVAGMLFTTNDAFFAVRGVNARSKADGAVDARAYDAGSEVNSEQCAFIPGPPCGNPGKHDTTSAEGYVYIHPGIHDIGDLASAEFDWRNPVATIMFQKVK
jgi:hypothetical protein